VSLIVPFASAIFFGRPWYFCDGITACTTYFSFVLGLLVVVAISSWCKVLCPFEVVDLVLRTEIGDAKSPRLFGDCCCLEDLFCFGGVFFYCYFFLVGDRLLGDAFFEVECLFGNVYFLGDCLLGDALRGDVLVQKRCFNQFDNVSIKITRKQLIC
jgi:hypothetical protein